MAYATSLQLSDLNIPLNRLGGNNTSRYNWQLNADNRGSDWFFESVPYPSAVAGEVIDTFVGNSKASSARAMVTIPMLDWIAKLGVNRAKLASFNVQKYGAQTNADWSYFPNAGNGVLKSTGKNIVGNDPNDANVPNNPAYQQAHLRHLVSKWGTSGNGGVGYYILDNEPSIWYVTHRDVHPKGPTMAEVRDRIIQYAAAIKTIDATAKIVAPEEWGWSGYFYSGADIQWGNANGWGGSLPDRTANGGWDYMPWLLKELKAESVRRGVSLIDVFSLHYYPQSGEYGNDVTTTTQLKRNVSTRSLWDPNYVDKSWIASKVQLIPRMRQWVNTYFPGLPIAITEYNWGASGHINGATTQADILGIFGREGLDMASHWGTPPATSPKYKAFKLFRNPDGSKKGFGDTSVLANVPNPDNLSAFAALRSVDGALTVMVVNKVLSGNTPVTLNLANFSHGASASAFQLTSANAITPLANVAVASGKLSLNVPPQSVTLLVVPASSGSVGNPAAPTNLKATGGTGQISLTWTASASAGVTQYQVFRATSINGTFTRIATLGNVTNYTNTGLTAGATCWYRVRALTSGGLASVDSNTASATVSGGTAGTPAAPTNLVATAGTGRITLNWTASTSTNVTQYRVYRSTSATGTFTRIAILGVVTNYADTGLTAGTKYFYFVRAGNAANQLSANSNTVNATVQ